MGCVVATAGLPTLRQKDLSSSLYARHYAGCLIPLVPFNGPDSAMMLWVSPPTHKETGKVESG